MFGRSNRAAKKLTLEEVVEIRRRYDSGDTQGALARSFGISAVQIGRIVRGESWNSSNAPRRGAASPPPEVADEILQRILAATTAPPSLLDGGDAADETGGAGATTLAAKAKELGAK